MDDFKISLFESEYKEQFPIYKMLEEVDCRQLTDQISKKYDLDVFNIEEGLMLRQAFYKGPDALEGFQLINTLHDIGINHLSEVLINWYQFKRIDAFDINDLDKYFYDIWFPSSDDIDLFDRTLNWILSIRHDGCITFCKYNDQ